jgi:hypothetical protein
VEATNAGFIQGVGGKWNGNWMLSTITWRGPKEEEYELELIGAACCAEHLGQLRRPLGFGQISRPAPGECGRHQITAGTGRKMVKARRSSMF